MLEYLEKDFHGMGMTIVMCIYSGDQHTLGDGYIEIDTEFLLCCFSAIRFST